MRSSAVSARQRAARALALILAAGVVAISPASASGQTFQVECSNVQSVVTAVAGEPGHGEGDVIALNGMCTTIGVTIPAGSNFTLQGAPGTTSGFDGTVIAGSLLTAPQAGALTVADLTFEHGHDSGSPAVSLRGTGISLIGDSFLEDTNENSTSGALFVGASTPAPCPPAGGPPAITLLESLFRGNTLTVGGGVGGGGAAALADRCIGSQSVIEGNRFEGNTLRANGSERAVGGALLFDGETIEPVQLTQARNVFEGNRILDVAGTGNYGGGGEWLEGASLASVDDRFTANSIPGTSGANWSWGGGLGIVGCDSSLPTQNELENAVIAGNSISGGTPADAGGGGLYVGCGKALTTPNQLALLDSTVTENSVPSGGIAGIAGKPSDQLRLANSIVANDLGGEELGGFEGAGGSLTAAFSDVCKGGVALAGAGNICEDPLLVDDGNPSSADVRETGSSPTIDAGSNSLVPASLTTDYLGDARIQAARSFLPACTPGATIGLTRGPPIVDIGAHEAPPLPVALFELQCGRALLAPWILPPPSVSVHAAGVLRLAFKKLPAGRLSARAVYKRRRSVVVLVNGRRRRVHRVVSALYGSASVTLTSRRAPVLRLRPTRQALAALRRLGRLTVSLTCTYAASGHASASVEHTFTVRYIAPHRRRHR